MAGNIEDFLRRAISQKLGKRVEDVEIVPDGQGPAPARSAMKLGNEGVAEHVSHHLDTSQYDDRASRLAEDINQADERLEEHIHDAFDHAVGALDHDEEGDSQETGQGKKSARQSLWQMFRSKSALRNAILIREVFDRPEHRW
ncbi:MAG: hypothetical protein OSB47_02105 [Pirellulaceae bacterium]|jgi:hypothetical protein|nr:hypothetical protein [Pirellulaceae bacterium]